MKKGLLLLLGVILIVILSYFCFMGKAQGINEDLVSKSQTAYKGKQMGWIDVALKGKELEMTRTLVLSGVAPSAGKREEAEVMAQAIEGVLEVDNQLIVKIAEPVAPIVKKAPIASVVVAPVAYKISVTKDKLKKVTLIGDVPSIEIHNELVAKAKTLFGDENVIDKLTELKGNPTAWKESITLGLDRLAEVDYGHFNIDDKDFNFEGQIADKEKKIAILKNLNTNLNSHYAGTYKITVPEVKVAKVVKPVAPSPYTISVIKGESNQITLSGYVANSEVHQELLTEATNLVGIENVIDTLKEIEGSPEGWKESARHGLAKLADVDYGRFNMSDTNFHFEGYIGTEEKKALLLSHLEENLSSDYEGTYNIESAKIKVAETLEAAVPSPYTISVIKGHSNQITLSGYVPNTEVHNQISTQANDLLGADNVIDLLKEIDGSPEEWSESVTHGLAKLADVDYGRFNMSDTNFHFEGYVGTEEEKALLLTKLADKLSSNYDGTYEIEAPKVIIPSPYTIMAIKDKNNTKQITLTGYVANADMHNELVSHATGLFGDGNVIDELQEIKGSPEAWKESSLLGLDKLSLVDYGQFDISDTNYNFRGYIGSEDAKALMLTNLKSNLNSNYIGTYDIEAPIPEPIVPSYSCQEHFESLLAKEKIHFEYDRAVIKKSSYGVLDKLVDIANQCPNAQIEVEGHTDSDGSEKYNQNLSTKRANAVRTYLIGKNIQSSRLKAIGYGEVKPVATNTTSKGKEQNRRIEFNVKGME